MHRIRDLALLAGGQMVTPKIIPGLIGWWRADSFALGDDTEVGGVGVEWIDQSGAGRHAATTFTKPKYRANIFGTMPAIEFTAADQSFLAFTTTGQLASLSVCVVMRAKSSDTIYRVMVGSSGSPETFAAESTNKVLQATLRDNTTIDTAGWSGAINSATPTCATMVMDNAAGTVRIFEKLTERVNQSVTGLMELNYIGTGNTIGRFLDGHIAELAIWDTALTDAHRALLFDQWFKPRYSL